MKPLFYLLTAAAHPFGLYVVVPLYMEHCYVVTGSDGAGGPWPPALPNCSP